MRGFVVYMNLLFLGFGYWGVAFFQKKWRQSEYHQVVKRVKIFIFCKKDDQKIFHYVHFLLTLSK